MCVNCMTPNRSLHDRLSSKVIWKKDMANNWADVFPEFLDAPGAYIAIWQYRWHCHTRVPWYCVWHTGIAILLNIAIPVHVYQMVPWYTYTCTNITLSQKQLEIQALRYERIRAKLRSTCRGGCHKQQKQNSDAADDPTNPPKSYLSPNWGQLQWKKHPCTY